MSSRWCSSEPRSCPPHPWLQSKSPSSSVPNLSGNERMQPGMISQILAEERGCTYHIPPQIGFFVLLEAFEILKYTRARIFDILFGDL